MNKKTLTLAAIALAMAACTQNETTNAPAGKSITIAASINQEPDTRIAFESDAGQTKVLWSEDDFFNICYPYGSQIDKHRFTLAKGAGETSADFTNTTLSSVEVPAERIYGVKFGTTEFVAGKLRIDLDFTAQNDRKNDCHLMTAMVENTDGTIKNWEDMNFNFENKTAILEITLITPNAVVGGLSNITVSGPGLYSKCKYDLTNGDFLNETRSIPINVDRNTVASSAKNFTFRIAQPADGQSSGPITINATANGANYTATLGNGYFNEAAIYKVSTTMIPAGENMQFTLKTTAKNEKFILPFATDTGDYTLTVDWGDGETTTINRYTSNESTDIAHKYTEVGTYTVTLTSDAPAGSAQMPKWDFITNVASAALLKSMRSPLLTMEGTDLSSCFVECRNLETIHPALFSKNTQATSFEHCFANCKLLKEIPNGLFFGLNDATNFKSCFHNCINARINPNIFCDDTKNASTRFSSKDMDFWFCFGNVGSNLEKGQAGTAPRLWKYNFKSVVTNYCFYNCKNMTNFKEISNIWVSYI